MATRRESRSGRNSAAAGIFAALVIVVLALLLASNRPSSAPRTSSAAATPQAPEPGTPNPAASAGGSCPVPSTLAPGQVADTLTREQAIEIAQAHMGGKVDAVRAQLMTLDEYVKGAGQGPVPGKSPRLGAIANDDLIWVVSLTGVFGATPPGGGDQWAVVLIDAVTGQVVGEEVRNEEPASFSDLPDRTRHERPSC